MIYLKKMILIFFLGSVIFSCKQENIEFLGNDRYEMSGQLESQPKERLRNAILELTEISKEVLQDQQALAELMQVSKSKYHFDHYFSLKDMLHYERSPLHQKVSVDEEVKGKFKQAFNQTFKGKESLYPNLSYYVEQMNVLSANNGHSRSFTENAELYFYTPYTLDYSASMEEPTLVPAVIEADEALGYKTTLEGQTLEVMVDDDYAEVHLTIIVTPESSYKIPIDCDRDPDCVPYPPVPDDEEPSAPTPTGNKYTAHCYELEEGNEDYYAQVLIGYAELNRNYDKLISLTGNGGGSEIRILRVDGVLARDQQGSIIDHEAPDKISTQFSRRDVRRNCQKWISAPWDDNWNCEVRYEQMLVIYEEDNVGDINITGSLVFQDQTIFSANVFIQNNSKDAVIRQRVLEHNAFFTNNMTDYGCGMKAGEYSFSNRSWPWYDCGTDFAYTMPHRFID